MLADIGMLQNKNDVKLLVLYVLRAIDRPVSEEQLGDCIMGTGSANYFDYTEAFDELLRSDLKQSTCSSGSSRSPYGRAPPTTRLSSSSR